MTKEFVSYEQALALKYLGFDEPCFGSYVKLTETQNTFFMNDVVSEIDRETPLHRDLITKTPLYQQALRWFREEHNLHNGIVPYYDYYYYLIKDFIADKEYQNDYDYDQKSYEEAEQACLEKLIEIVTQWKHQ